MDGIMSVSIGHQVARLERIYEREIAYVKRIRDDPKELADFLALVWFGKGELKGYDVILPYYYLLRRDYSLTWTLLNYLNLYFGISEQWYDPHGQQELESPVTWDMKPLWVEEGEDKELLRRGRTCFRLTADYPLTALQQIETGDDENDPYEISPTARHRTVDGNRQHYLSYWGLGDAMYLMQVYFRREQIPETEECLFRLRHIASLDGPPKGLLECPTTRHISAWVNTYDYWYQARRETDPERRKMLAWTALYWFLESGLRLVGNGHIDSMVDFAMGCEIIGEFELMEEDHVNFIRHLKRFVMHASISYCRKMMASPIELIPFAERKMPNYYEFQAVFKRVGPTVRNSKEFQASLQKKLGSK